MVLFSFWLARLLETGVLIVVWPYRQVGSPFTPSYNLYKCIIHDANLGFYNRQMSSRDSNLARLFLKRYYFLVCLQFSIHTNPGCPPRKMGPACTDGAFLHFTRSDSESCCIRANSGVDKLFLFTHDFSGIFSSFTIGACAMTTLLFYLKCFIALPLQSWVMNSSPGENLAKDIYIERDFLYESVGANGLCSWLKVTYGYWFRRVTWLAKT